MNARRRAHYEEALLRASPGSAWSTPKHKPTQDGRNVAFCSPLGRIICLSPTPSIGTVSQSGTPVGSPTYRPPRLPTPAPGGHLRLPVDTPIAGSTPYLVPAPLYHAAMSGDGSFVAPAPGTSVPPLHPPSPQPIVPLAPPLHVKTPAPGGKSYTTSAANQSKSAFNIYTRDMLPTLPEKGIARDPKWKSVGAEHINVLMPVNLLDCWLIFYNAQRVREVHFWHVLGDDSGRKFPEIKVQQLETLSIHHNEAWLTNLLRSLRIGALTHLAVYYAASCGEKFSYDQEAYLGLFRRAEGLKSGGLVCISPNHPHYWKRGSKLARALYDYFDAYVEGHHWVFRVTDTHS
ncbi:hypothetical protein K525DRAFT_193477 [Schizophyllum commune Loenen D]|nr:hypothetical protein K525DRAFT_193477 [Schizophyllum commune Loenen D]